MPSGVWSGLAEGVSPFAQELFKSRLKRAEEERKPGAQLQRGLVDALRSMQQAPTTADLQAQSDLAEQNAQPGSRLDMNSAIQTMAGGASPEMVGQANQGERFMGALNKMGITSLGADSIGLSKYGAGNSTVQTGYFDPDTKEFVMTGDVPRGSVIKSAASSVGTTKEKAIARGEGYTEGRMNVAGMDAGQSNAITGNRAVVRSVDNLLRLYDTDPNIFERSSTPGARAIFLGDEGVKEIELWRNNLLNYKAFSEGGKQLTATELSRTISTMTSLIRGEPVSRKAIEEMRLKAQENLALQEGSYSKSKLGAQDDFSSMSDDELRAIAGGQ